MASMKEIAKRCNVSIATVSKAINDYSDIGEETKSFILKTASEMGYLPNSSARALKTKRSYNLGVLFVDEGMSGLTHDYFNHVLESFRKTAQDKGYDITFAIGKDSGRKMNYYEHCRYRGVDGVIMACVNFYSDEVQELVRSSIPIVTIDHVFDGRIAVVSNNASGMEKLVQYIYSKGHRRIAYIHGEDTSVTKTRLASFFRTCMSLGIRVRMNTSDRVPTGTRKKPQKKQAGFWIFRYRRHVSFTPTTMQHLEAITRSAKEDSEYRTISRSPDMTALLLQEYLSQSSPPSARTPRRSEGSQPRNSSI